MSHLRCVKLSLFSRVLYCEHSIKKKIPLGARPPLVLRETEINELLGFCCRAKSSGLGLNVDTRGSPRAAEDWRDLLWPAGIIQISALYLFSVVFVLRAAWGEKVMRSLKCKGVTIWRHGNICSVFIGNVTWGCWDIYLLTSVWLLLFFCFHTYFMYYSLPRSVV